MSGGGCAFVAVCVCVCVFVIVCVCGCGCVDCVCDCVCVCDCQRCSIVKHAVDAAWQLLQKSLLSIYVLYLHAPVRVMFAKLF